MVLEGTFTVCSVENTSLKRIEHAFYSLPRFRWKKHKKQSVSREIVALHGKVG